MIQELLLDARAGKPVYITTVHEAFARLESLQSERIVCVVDLLDQDGRQAYELRIPLLEHRSGEDRRPDERKGHAPEHEPSPGAEAGSYKPSAHQA